MFMNSSQECTAVAVLPEVTAEQKIWIGQNWDWLPRLKGSLILLEIEQPKRPTILMVAEAGIVGKIGMNSSGIGVCLNILSANGPKRGVPVHVILRGILNSDTLGDALGAILRMGSGGCSHFLIATQEGEAIGMEVGFQDVDPLYPREGMLTHANHFLRDRSGRVDQGRVRFPDSLLRDYRALKLLRQKKEKLTLSDLQGVLQDHFNYPHSICRHPDSGKDEWEEIISLVSIVMDLTSGTIYLAEGPPCKHSYGSFSLPQGRVSK
jgi:isopenicillin-N N-acyltransferase-like protein